MMNYHCLKKRSKLSKGIKTALYSLSVVGACVCSSVDASNPVVRSSTQAFSIPYEVVDKIVIGPAITTMGGQNYLQFVISTDRDNSYQNIIAGPVDRLFDRTIPWDDQVYLNQSFDFDSLTYPYSYLIDLNNDGINTLVSDNKEYDINNNNEIISEDVFNGAISFDAFEDAMFLDVDGDDDLDVLVSDWKYGGSRFYENTGSPEVPVFSHSNSDVGDVLSGYFGTLPVGFYDYFTALFPYSFPSVYDYPIIFDFDTDGDLDLLMARDVPNDIKYFEQSNNQGMSQYSEPFASLPFGNAKAVWITDYDTDGDLDLLVYSLEDEFCFFERNNQKNPHQYADPVTITNFPTWTGSYFLGIPNAISISGSRGVFADLDNNGYQEMLVVRSTDYREYQLLLLKKGDDDRFEQQIIYQGTDIEYGAVERLEFVDANNDGKLDIALQFYYPENGETQSILLFEQQEPFTFAGPETLAPDALSFTQIRDTSIDVDLDGDGDIDTVYNTGVDWNLDSNPGSVVNFSTRSYVGEGANILIGGFIIEGRSPQTVILRGIGPSLADKGISDPLQDPELFLFSGDKLIAHNDDWGLTDGADMIEAAGVGLEYPRESGLRVRLDPGVYTVHLKGKPGDTGVGIIGVDADNQMPTNSLQVNISGRAFVDEGEAITIGGFVIEGDTPVKVLIRGLGPQLRDKGVSNALNDPNITLFSGSTIIASNNDWKNGANAAEISQLDIAPEQDREAAILRELEPGTYTVHLHGATGDTGVGIIAVDRL